MNSNSNPNRRTAVPMPGQTKNKRRVHETPARRARARPCRPSLSRPRRETTRARATDCSQCLGASAYARGLAGPP
eukprot:5103841-Lingulodinium_polyedra.AAC.1